MKGLPSLPFKFTSRFLIDNLSNTGRTKKQILSFAIDGALVAICIWVAFSLRLGQPYSYLDSIAHLMILLPPLTVFIFAGLGIYRWVVRSSSSRQFEQIIKGAIASSIVLLTMLYLFPVTSAPRSVFLIYGVLLTLSTVGLRAIWAKIHNDGVEKNGKPIAVYGAGAAGRQLVNLMRFSDEYHPEFFLDDSELLIGSTVSGLPVLNPQKSEIQSLLKKHAVEEIVMALPSITGDEYSKLLNSVESYGVPIKTIPPIREIVSGKSSPDDLREIKLEDLLGRDPVEPDNKLLTKNITGKRVLVTGAGGSIGSELCRQILQLEPESLLMLDNSEPSLYTIDQEIHEQLQSVSGKAIKIETLLASVTDQQRLDQVFRICKPHTVYHAAAYKHVPLVENNPFEGVKTNIFGTQKLALTAQKYGTETFALISTDKAVRPANVMGACKRVAEMVLQAMASEPIQKTTFCMVRFGNVLGSSGSVVPKFQKQIKSGGPVTVTHPEMTRYFMTISEAVSLVIQAGSMAQGGEVFLLDMGPPVKILDLAKALIRLHGMESRESSLKRLVKIDQGNEIEITFSGIRNGEKLYEELLIGLDRSRSTKHKKIRKSLEAYTESSELESKCIEQLRLAVGKCDETLLRTVLREFVHGYETKDKPEYARVSIDSGKNPIDGYTKGVDEVNAALVKGDLVAAMNKVRFK